MKFKKKLKNQFNFFHNLKSNAPTICKFKNWIYYIIKN